MRADAGVRAFGRAAITSLAVAAFLVAVVASLGPVGALAHPLGVITRICISASHVVSDLAALWLVALALASTAVGATSVAASVVLQRRRRWVSPGDGQSRIRVARVARDRGIHSRARVFASTDVLAYSRGLWRPSIWISDGAVSALDDHQLAAVLAHEDHHCSMRDPIKRVALDIAAHSFFAFPVVADAARSYRRNAEFAADDAASGLVGVRATATALLLFAGAASRPGLVQFGASTTVAERVQRLLGAVPDDQVFTRRAIVATAVVVTSVATGLAVIALVAA